MHITNCTQLFTFIVINNIYKNLFTTNHQVLTTNILYFYCLLLISSIRHGFYHQTNQHCDVGDTFDDISGRR